MPRLETFVEDLRRSKLITRAEIERARADLGPDSDASALARALIGRGLLTRYQAQKVLNGRTWGFFLGDYRILHRLGAGGMGKVYLARRERDGQPVAIKVLPPKKALEDEQALRRFYREMELSRRLRHPNLARTLEVGAVGDAHYMVMEYIPGDSLFNLVKREHGGSGPLRVPDAARYFLKVLAGLHAAHEAGLVHRDIKPSNLMITPDGDAKILDLGLAKATGEVSPLTHPNAVIGTLDYASPEQLADASRADRRSDLYSVGCTLYFALAGRPPFEGGDIVSKIFRHRMEDPEPLEQVAHGVPQAFGAIVRRLMAKEPGDRYQTAAELADDLTRWTDPERVRALLGSRVDEAAAFRPPPPDLDEEDLRIEDDPSRNSNVSLLNVLRQAEGDSAPYAKAAPTPRPAIVLDDDDPYDGDEDPVSAAVPITRGQSGDDLRWVVRFAVIAAVLGLLAILAIGLINAS